MKRFVFGLATCAIALASCSTNDVLEQGSGSNNPNVINFSATTTRATVNNLGNVKGGFPVYAVTTKNTGGVDALAWHINGQTYKFEGNTWKWIIDRTFTTAPQWPALKTFPMNFYAYYPADGDKDGFVPNAATVGILTGTFTINGTADTQIDFLAANSSKIERIPQGGSVPLAFNHITTKINFGVIAAAGTKSYVQQMNINNVKNKGTYDYVADPKGQNYAPWSIDQQELPGKYDYWETAVANTEPEGAPKVTKDFACVTGGAEDAAPFYTEPSADHHLMLLPQSETPVWAPEKSTGSSINPDGAYIGSVYRMTDGAENNEKDLVGYSDASNHPNYEGSQTSAAGYTGPLFVKVGFPLTPKVDETAPTFTWVMGKAYTYNIKLGQNGATGGYILDEHYYDEMGKPTDLTINGKDPGEPVSGGTINFDVTVGEWTDETVAPIQ